MSYIGVVKITNDGDVLFLGHQVYGPFNDSDSDKIIEGLHKLLKEKYGIGENKETLDKSFI